MAAKSYIYHILRIKAADLSNILGELCQKHPILYRAALESIDPYWKGNHLVAVL